MQVAADVVRLDEGRRVAAEGLLAQLRRAPGQVERAVEGRPDRTSSATGAAAPRIVSTARR
ncbi:MAG: hypothetical protein ACRDLA_08250 [Thermoleophilaceae bacterium]